MPDALVERLTEAFPGVIEPLETPFDIPQVRVNDPAQLVEICQWLKEEGFNMLLDIGGVDYLPRPSRFEVVYHLLDMSAHRRLRLRVIPNEEEPEVPSVGEIWPSALAPEREVYDLFGIVFTGHPDLRRIMLPDNWRGHPLRKDYPLQGPQFNEEKKFPAQQARFRAPKLPGTLEPGK